MRMPCPQPLTMSSQPARANPPAAALMSLSCAATAAVTLSLAVFLQSGSSFDTSHTCRRQHPRAFQQSTCGLPAWQGGCRCHCTAARIPLRAGVPVRRTAAYAESPFPAQHVPSSPLHPSGDPPTLRSLSAPPVTRKLPPRRANATAPTAPTWPSPSAAKRWTGGSTQLARGSLL